MTMIDVRKPATRRRSARTEASWADRDAAARPYLVAIVVARMTGDQTAVADAVRVAVATLMPVGWAMGVGCVRDVVTIVLSPTFR